MHATKECMCMQERSTILKKETLLCVLGCLYIYNYVHVHGYIPFHYTFEYANIRVLTLTLRAPGGVGSKIFACISEGKLA